MQKTCILNGFVVVAVISIIISIIIYALFDETLKTTNSLLFTVYQDKMMNNDKKLLLMHIPKTAGNSLEMAALNANIKWGKKIEITKSPLLIQEMCQKMNICNTPFGLHHVPIRKFIEYFENIKHIHNGLNNTIYEYLMDIYDKYYNLNNVNYFCVIRNPYNRVISEYQYSLYYQHPRHNLAEYNWSKYFYDRNTECSANAINFFIQNTIKKIKSLQNNNESFEYCYKGCHWISQYEYIFDQNGNQICKHIIHLENIEKEFYELLRLYDLEETIILPKRHINNHKICHNLQSDNISNKSKQMMQEFFYNDFDLWDNYTK
eukprot:241609_1